MRELQAALLNRQKKESGKSANFLFGVVSLIRGNLADSMNMLSGIFFILLALPFASCIYMMIYGESRRRQVFQMIAWMLVLVHIAYLILILQPPGSLHPALWGVRIFMIALAIGIMMEGLLLFIGRKRDRLTSS